MEYLKSINESLDRINDQNIRYIDLFKHPSLVFGNTKKSDRVDFCKYTDEVHDSIRKFGDEVNGSMHYHKTSTCGNRIRLKTNSRRLVFKVELKRGRNYRTMVTWNSSGFDVYVVNKNGYSHQKLIAPKEGNRIFADEMRLPENSSICIFLPNFDTIKKMYLGFERYSKISTFNYPKFKRSPIIFYGNNVTQGASATKSGNSYPNIVSRKLNNDIINLSMDKCCKATKEMAEMIGNLDCDSVVIDYSRDASNLEEFKQSHELFYKTIRKAHPNKKIILMTTPVFNKLKKYDSFDDVIIQTYKNAVKRHERTYLLNQMELFDENEYDFVALDDCHYTDYGMFKIAEEITKLLK